MARYLESRFGKIKPFKDNPRTISDAAFTKLCASIERDPEFMVTRPIIVDENNAILGGNQRQYALLALGYEKVPDEWVRQVVGWSDEKKRRFVLIDNSPEGMAGEFDYDMMAEKFSLDVMADAGIDFSNLDTLVQEDAFKTSEEKAEEGAPFGEKDPTLVNFIDQREKSRANLEGLTDVSFYLCAIFQSREQKEEFIRQAQLPVEQGLFTSGLFLADKLNIPMKRIEYDFAEPRTDQKLTELALENEQDTQAHEMRQKE